MKTLITGRAGYIGSVLTPTLLQAGHKVTVLDSFICRQNSLADCCRYDSFEVVRGDCRDERLMEKRLQKHLNTGRGRLQDIAKAVPGGKAGSSTVLRERLQALQSWHDKTRAQLPLAKTFLKISQINKSRGARGPAQFSGAPLVPNTTLNSPIESLKGP